MFKRLAKNITFLLSTLLVVALMLEAALRLMPQYMPYSQVWNYRHHYSDIAKVIYEDGYLETLSPSLLLLGDSFTRGAEVPPERDWGSIIAGDTDLSILNGGIGGASTVEEYLFLSDFNWPDSLKTVLLEVYENDIRSNRSDVERLRKEGAGVFYRRIEKTVSSGYDKCGGKGWYKTPYCYHKNFYLIATVNNLILKWKRGEEFLPDADTTALIYDDASKTYIRKSSTVGFFRSDKSFRGHYGEGFDHTVKAIADIKGFLDSIGVRLLVVYFPSKSEVYLEDLKGRFNEGEVVMTSVGKVLDERVRSMGIPYLDLTDRFREVRLTKAPIYKEFDTHMTMGGHRLAASWISAFLKEEGVLE